MKLLVLILLMFATFPAMAAPTCVMDSWDREVCLEAPAARVVTLAPHLAENVFSAGAGERLVGVARHSDFPVPVQEITRIGDFNAFSLEKIVSLAPDLVLLWGSGNGTDALADLERLGLTVYVDELRRLEDIPGSIRNIGRLAGSAEIADAAAAAYSASLERYRAERPAAQLRVFYQIWHQPLQTVGGEHLISEVMTLCGGNNLFADSTALAPRVSLEAVLDRDPEVIIASGMDSGEPPWLREWQRYPDLSAVRSGAVYFVDPDTLQRPTTRILQGLESVCDRLTRARRLQANVPESSPQ